MSKKERLESLVIAEFHRLGMIDAKDCTLRPATGHWRTDWRADVYRFEGEVYIRGHIAIINSWHTMTELIKTGVSIDNQDGDWFVSPKTPTSDK